MLHKEFNNGLRAYPIHQAVQTIGSTAVLKPAILVSATAMILAHNHPSEDVSPSREDEAITARIIKAAHIIGIKVHEHLIISMWGERYFSFADAGIIKKIYDAIG